MTDLLVLETTAGPTGLIEAYLIEQQSLSAVDRFSQRHAGTSEPLQSRYYKDLLPSSPPKPGQQYAFEVDLDSCSGCKACVTACHELNGLDDDETWRSVGLLLGGTSELPLLQHVTSACHHCLEPACLLGCPVNAYAKDPLTGIVRHLDDQCIGCQYCIFKCPYDVPKYNGELGIVRKCDMCSDRLSAGEAPACVQACPTEAIRITLVDQWTVVEESETNQFLPGAPEPDYTLPTTVYKTNRPLPRNLLPADHYRVTPGHGHPALVWMLVLTQMAVGTIAIDWSLELLGADATWTRLQPIRAIAAFMVGLLGLGAAVGHLGRPLYAFRAIIGLRTSWLSREILAFGIFAATAALYAAQVGLKRQGVALPTTSSQLLAATAISGLFGVFCSVMIYVDTRRPFWNFTSTTLKFFLTGLVLGFPALVLVSLGGALVQNSASAAEVFRRLSSPLLKGLMVATIAKLVLDALVFTHLRDKKYTLLKRSAVLLIGDLRPIALGRLIFGLVGGFLIPLILTTSAATRWPAHAIAGLVALCLITTMAGELLERRLFFTASVAPKMPGAIEV